MMKVALLVLLGFVALSAAKVYFKEDFEDADWENRWVVSKNKGAEGGKWGWTAGKFYNDAEKDKGIQTTEDARFYQISAEFPEFSNKGKDLVVQYRIKHEQNIDCGGGYLKLLPKGVDRENFNGDDAYNIMFGPDICGSGTKKTHLIFSYKGKNHLVKNEIRCEADEHSHLYTLILHPDNTYEVRIDNKEARKGSLKEDFDILAPKEIPDPDAKKPADWVDDAEIADPEEKKPEGYDDIPAEIPDPDAKKPDDWDDELDGEWEPPLIDNPKYQGPWSPKKIPNPAYKGAWVHPQVANPDYVDDENLYAYDSFGVVGIEIWQVKAGTIFDNILVSDSVADAESAAADFEKLQKGEKAAFDKAEEERKAKEDEERKKREEEEKKNEEEKEEEAEEEEEEGKAEGEEGKDEL
jgi:calreticulin